MQYFRLTGKPFKYSKGELDSRKKVSTLWCPPKELISDMEIGQIELGSDRYPARESRYFGQIGLRNPLSDRISDPWSVGLEIDQIGFG